MRYFRINLTRWDCGVQIPVHSFIMTAANLASAKAVSEITYPSMDIAVKEINHEPSESHHAEGSPRLRLAGNLQ